MSKQCRSRLDGSSSVLDPHCLPRHFYRSVVLKGLNQILFFLNEIIAKLERIQIVINVKCNKWDMSVERGIHNVLLYNSENGKSVDHVVWTLPSCGLIFRSYLCLQYRLVSMLADCLS